MSLTANGIAELLFLAMFFFLYLGVPVLVAWLSYVPQCRIDLSQLWTHNNRPDKFAAIILGTWWVHTCSMILWTLSRSVTTTDYLTYMGWAIPVIMKMITNDRKEKDDSLLK